MISTFEIDQKARKCLRASLPDDWTLTPPVDDIGLDYWVQVTKSGIPTSINFFIQLKGTTIGQIADGHLVHSVSVEKIIQYLENPLPVLLVICHISENASAPDIAYYCWVRDHVSNVLGNNREKPEQWLQKQTITIRIPNTKILTPEVSSEILLPFLESFRTRHVAQESNHMSFIGKCKELAELLHGCDDYFVSVGIDPKGDQALEIKKLAIAGYLLSEASRHSEAISYYEAANSICPTPDVLLSLGYCYSALGDFSSALLADAEGLKLAPTNALLMSNIGTTLFSMGRLSEALSFHERAANLDEKNSRQWANLGATLEYIASTQRESGESRDTLERALCAYEKAMALDPEDSFTLSDMGLVLSKMYRFPQAVQILNKAVLLNPRTVSAWIRLSRACIATRDYARAEEAIRYLFMIGVDTKEVHNLSALIDMNKAGEYKDSFSHLMESLRDTKFEKKKKKKKKRK